MSPAGKFWLGVLILVITFLVYLIPMWLSIMLYVIYSIIAFFIYISEISSDSITNEQSEIIVRRPPYKYSLILGLIILIRSFNRYINNKFKKND